MVKRKIIWLRTAELDMLDLMLYYIERNKSKAYSTSLYQGISKNLKNFKFYDFITSKNFSYRFVFFHS